MTKGERHIKYNILLQTYKLKDKFLAGWIYSSRSFDLKRKFMMIKKPAARGFVPSAVT